MLKEALGSVLGFAVGKILPERILWIFARRFIAGKDEVSALDLVRELNKDGFRVSLDYIGEHHSFCEEIARARSEYTHIIAEIKRQGIDGDISLKLSQLGLLQDEFSTGVLSAGLCAFGAIVNTARENGVRVFIDAEELKWRETTWDLVRSWAENYQNIGIRIQAYAKDAPEFFARQLREGWKGPTGVCKGAYREARSLVVAGQSLRENFIELCRLAANSGIPLQIDTHDEELALEVELAIGDAPHEHGLLRGVAPAFAGMLRNTGETVNIYTPYGSDYKAYVVRRVAEHPEYILLPFRS